jgi:aerobic carbon-monoxide dehydrogenase medium subunit
VKPPPFDYSCPDTLEAAIDLLAEVGDEGRPLAGGQSLIPLLSLRLARPSHLIDLGRIGDLQAIDATDSQLVVGAMVRERKAEASEQVRRLAPLLADALPLIGHPAIRSRGTIGGSLSHADPAAELPVVARVVEAQLVAQSRDRGRRTVTAADFFTGFFSTALEPDEILTEVRIDAPGPGTGWAIDEVARRHGDFAMVGAAAMVRIDPDSSKIAEARVALSGVSDTPLRVADAEQMLAGADPTDEACTEAAQKAAAALSPPADVHGSSAYRRHVAGFLIQRTLAAAAAKAKEAA